MKKIIFIITLFLNTIAYSQVGIGTQTPSNKSILDLTATDKGFLLPRMTSTERNNINPNNGTDKGMQVFDTTTNTIWFWNGSIWTDTGAGDKTNDAFVNNTTNTKVELGTNSDGTTVRTAGTEFVIKDDGRVGMSIADPDISARLDVSGLGGIKFPTMTYAEVLTIPSPANGLRVFCTTYNVFLTNLGTPSVPNWFAEVTASINPSDVSTPAGTIRVASGLRSNINKVVIDDIEFFNFLDTFGNHMAHVRTTTNRQLRGWSSSEWSSTAGSQHSVGTFTANQGGQWTRNNYSISSTTDVNGVNLHPGLSAALQNMLENETNKIIVLDEEFDRLYEVIFYNYTVNTQNKVVITVTKLK